MDNKLQEEIKKLTKGIIVYDLLILLALAITFNLNKQMVLGLVFGTLIAILNLKLLAITINKTVSMPSTKAQSEKKGGIRMSQAKWVWFFGNFKLSETVVVSWIIIAALAIISFLLTRNLKKVPTSKVQIFLEFAIGGLDKMVKNTMGEKTVKRMPNIVPYIGSLFFFFACSNLIGLLGFRSPTTDLDTTLAWAMITFCMIYYAGVKFHGLKYFKGLLEPIPFLLPLNIIGEVAKPISLSFRPFGNILGGAVIMALLYRFLGWLSTLIPGVSIPIGQLVIPVPLHLYFDLFAGVLQAFIFIMLTMVFVGNAAEE